MYNKKGTQIKHHNGVLLANTCIKNHLWRISHKLSTAVFSLTNGLNYSTNGGSMQEEFLQYVFFLSQSD
jgi:hypothetical protein